MWTSENRARYDRGLLRYPSDLTDEEWRLIESGIPPAKRGGNKRTVTLREVVNGLMYILSTGCQWRAIPFGAFPFLLKLYADGGYQGREFQAAVKKALGRVNVEIVKRSDQVTGFFVLPKRWIVERTFAWLNRCRRLAKDWECLNRKALG